MCVQFRWRACSGVWACVCEWQTQANTSYMLSRVTKNHLSIAIPQVHMHTHAHTRYDFVSFGAVLAQLSHSHAHSLTHSHTNNQTHAEFTEQKTRKHRVKRYYYSLIITHHPFTNTHAIRFRATCERNNFRMLFFALVFSNFNTATAVCVMSNHTVAMLRLYVLVCCFHFIFLQFQRSSTVVSWLEQYA